MIIIEAITIEEIREAFAWLATRDNTVISVETSSSVAESEIEDIAKQKKAEYNRRYYKSKKNSETEISEKLLNSEKIRKNSEKFSKNSENLRKIQKNSEISEIGQEKEEEKEEKALPLSSPSFLSSSPSDSPINYPITPYNPPLPKEEREEEKEPAAEPRNEPLPLADLILKKADKPKAKPEDDAFWNFAKENKPMAQAFWHVSGIAPVKREFGRWINDLRDLNEAGITIPQMQEAVGYMKQKNMPIGAPGSILRIARSMASPQPLSRSSPTTQEQKKSYTFSEIVAMRKQREIQTTGKEIIDL